MLALIQQLLRHAFKPVLALLMYLLVLALLVIVSATSSAEYALSELMAMAAVPATLMITMLRSRR